MYTTHKWESDKHFNFSYAKYLPKDFEIYQMRAEYRRQAHLGDELFPYIFEKRRDSR